MNKTRVYLFTGFLESGKSSFIQDTLLEQGFGEDEKTLILNVTMNEVTNPVRMDYTIENGKIVASGGIDILDFSMQKSYLAFAKKCADLHENKSFSEVDIEFTIPYK